MSRVTWGLCLILAACGTETEVPSTPNAGGDVMVEPIGEGTLPEAPVTRGFRRMDIGQLDASIRRVTGGIGWDDRRGRSEFDALAPTLGVPDYLERTTEDLSPGLLFQKFLDDAANDVCTELVSREITTDEPSRVLMVGIEPVDTLASAPEGVARALSLAVHRFHGQTVIPGDRRLAPWTGLFEAATAAAGGPEGAWRTVCVALITHPDFYTY